MKKKVFTLVELLAVIAILAILVIIALPNVLELYKNARKNAFLDEVQSVYTAAVNKYMLSQYGTGTTWPQTFTNTSGTNTLDIQGGTGTFKYCATVDVSGKVTSLKASNGTFSYTGTNIDQASKIQTSGISESTTNLSSCS